MIPKLKKFCKEHKKLIKIGLLVLVILIAFLVAYKLLFYSNNEKDIYGVRLRDIEANEFTKSDIKEVKEKVSSIAGVKKVQIEVKGRLIKFFVTFEDEISSDDIKTKFNELVGYISEKVHNYYDISLYSIQEKDGKEYYPVIGYKHKNNIEISFEVF